MDDLSIELQKIYDSEINISIAWLWDGGIVVRLGDELNGYKAEETVATIADVLPWLQEAIAYFYPSSTYAHNLDAAVAERAKDRVFLPPTGGATAICPYCGAANWTPGLEVLLAYVCRRCGESVQVKPPAVS
jgi:hypothetical protein